jgi:hypothetical protein
MQILCCGIALAACATAPEPKIEVREVKVAVPVRCDPQPRPVKPDFPDTDEAIKGAPDIFVEAQLYKAGRKLRIPYERELEAALSGCTGDPPPTP